MTQEDINRYCLLVIYTLIAIFVGVIIGILIDVKKYYNSSPVEEMDKVNKLTNSVDSIKLIIVNLDSIKKDEIQKVQTLDNDSTIKLFYELLRR
jgi:hypothetical protein